MRYFFLTLIVILSGCAPAAPTFTADSAALKSKKWTVAVLDLQYEYEGKGVLAGTNYESAGKDGGRIVAGLLSSELSAIPQLELVERGLLEKVMAEQSLQMTGITSSETAVEVGRLVGAEAVIVGDLTDYVYWSNLLGAGSTITFTIRMVDVENGRILMSSTVSRVRNLVEPLTNASLTAREVATQLQQKLQ